MDATGRRGPQPTGDRPIGGVRVEDRLGAHATVAESQRWGLRAKGAGRSPAGGRHHAAPGARGAGLRQLQSTVARVVRYVPPRWSTADFTCVRASCTDVERRIVAPTSRISAVNSLLAFLSCERRSLARSPWALRIVFRLVLIESSWVRTASAVTVEGVIALSALTELPISVRALQTLVCAACSSS